MSESTELARRLHDLAIEMAAMAQNGTNYATDRYEIARYARLREQSAELFGMIAGLQDAEPVRLALQIEAGHATPKVDVRGALFDAEERILLIREARNGLWNLPGGWADALDAPSTAVIREVEEEAGLRVRASRLAFVHDGAIHNGHANSPWHIYKLFFLVDRLDPDAQPVAGLDGETTDARFFSLDDLPQISAARTSMAQLRLLLAYHRDPALPTAFD